MLTNMKYTIVNEPSMPMITLNFNDIGIMTGKL